MSFFSNLTYRNNIHKNSCQKLQKRSLRLESLEERQLLTVAMDMALGAADLAYDTSDTVLMADPEPESTPETPSTVVTLFDGTIDDTDNQTSFAEAIEYAKQKAVADPTYKPTVTFADSLGDQTIDPEFMNSLPDDFDPANVNIDLGNRSLTIAQSLEIDGAVFSNGTIFVNEGESVTIDGGAMDTVTLINNGQLSISDVTFTGTYNNATAFDSRSYDTILENNGGTLNLDNVKFDGIEINYEISQYENYDEQSLDVSFALVSNNNGQLTVTNSDFTDNELNLKAVHGDVNGTFAAINTYGYGERSDGLTIVSRTDISGNAINGYSKHGDVTADMYGIYDMNAQIIVFSSIIYGQTASAESKYGNVGTNGEEIIGSSATGIFCETEDALILNSTILDKIALYRSEAVVLNSMYNETEFVRSGFLYNDADGSNLDLANADWSTIFPYWDAAAKTFTDRNYRIYVDNTSVVDAGNNEFLDQAFFEELFQEDLANFNVSGKVLYDLLGNNRTINETVDIGAVESNAVRLNARSLNPIALAQKDEVGLTKIDFSWGPSVIESDRVTFNVRYKLASADGTVDGNWTTLTGVGQGALQGVTYDAATNRYTWTVSGLTPGKTLYDFEVLGFGDGINYLDSTDWVSVNENTRERLLKPEYEQAAPQSETAITITWVTDPRAVAYEIVYAKNETPEATTTLKVQRGDGGVTIKEKTIAGESVSGAAYTITGLEEGVGYTITWRALSEYGFSVIQSDDPIHGDDYLLNSEWVTKTTSTKTVLSAPTINDVFTNTLTTLGITWTEGEPGTSSYTVEMGAVNPTSGQWEMTRTITTPNAAWLVSGLQPATEYSFRVKATGNTHLYVDSDWSAIKSFTTLTQLADPTISAQSVFTTEFTTDTLKVDWIAPANATDSVLTMSEDGETYMAMTPDNFENATFTANDNSVVITGLTAGETYYFKVVCSANPKVYAPSEASTNATTPTAVAAPVLSWSDKGDGTADITWNAIANSTAYVINDSVQTGLTLTTGQIATDAASRFTVYARGDQANNYASSASDTLDLKRLEAPANVSATTPPTGTMTIDVSWDEVENESVSGYRIQVLKDNTLTFVADTTENNYSVTNLKPGTTYNFRVQTLSESGNEGGMLISEFSDGDANATTLKAPYAPTALTANANGLHTVALTWTPAEEADNTYSYTIDAYLASDDSKVGNSITGLEGTSYEFTGLDENTTYYFKISANSTDPQFLGASETVESNEDTTWIQLATPELSLSDGGVDLDSVKLEWSDTNAIDDVANYEISYGDETITVPAGTTSKTIEGLEQGTEYTFTIVAKGKADRSVDSLPDTDATDGLVDTVKVTTWAQLDAPADIFAEADSTTEITVSWFALENADFGYTVTCDTLPDGAQIAVDDETQTATVTGLDPNTNYSFNVMAKGGTDETTGITYVNSEERSNSATTWQKLSISTFTATVNGMEITLNWTVPEGDDEFTEKYTVERSVDGNWVALDTETGLTATFTGDPSKDYSFRVMANSNQGDDGNSVWKELSNVETWDKLLVTDLTATAAGTQIINVAWDINPEGVDATYKLYRANGNQTEYSETDVTWTEVDLTGLVEADGKFSVLVSGLTAETPYTFAVFATATDYINSDAALDRETTWAVRPLTNSLVIDATAAGQTITVDWADVDGAVSYLVDYRWTGINGTNQTASKTVTDSTAVFTNLEPGVAYTFKVTANPAASDVDHSAAVSNEVTATTDTLKLATPDGTAVANNSGLSVQWEAVDNASGYEIQWRVAGSNDEWDSKDVDAAATTYTIDDVLSSTAYDIQITALGDAVHYTDSDPDSLNCQALITVELDAVVVLNKSEATATTKPESVEQIDEWTPAYLELWTDDIQGLVDGRELSATVTINDNYVASSVQDLPGTTVVIDGNTITVTIDMDYTGYADGTSAIVAQILLTPKSQANDNANGNGINVGGESETLVQFNDEEITNIVPVVYDLDDNGAIDGIDEALYAAYTKKVPTLVDYNNDGKNCSDDLRMLTRNKGKAQADDWNVDYSIIACTCSTDPTTDPTTDPDPAPVAAPAATFVSTMYVAEESAVLITEASSEFSIELAKMEKDLMPYQQEENRMTDGTILKKAQKTDKDSDAQPSEDSAASDVEINLDQFWADEQNADWRFA